MYLEYKPEGQDEPKRWKYDPKKLMSIEREDIERRTGRNYSQFTTDVLQGNSLCRRALLFTFLRREHRKIKFEDVDFAWDELKLDYTLGEWQEMRKKVLETQHGDDLATSLQMIDEQIETAWDDPEESGKARLPIAD